MDENMWTLDNDKGTLLGMIGNMRCTLVLDNFYDERLMIVADSVKASLMHFELEQGKG